MKRRPIRVLLVDGHAMVRAGLRQLIENRDGFTVIGEAGDAQTALAIVQAEHPDVVVLELELGEQSAIDFLPELRANGNGLRVLVVTGLRDAAIHKHAIKLGAHGVLLKHGSVDSLIKAIRKVHDGELWLDRSLAANVIADLTTVEAKTRNPEWSRIESLTPREREVIVLVAQGLKNKAVAAKLGISDTTVRHHLTAVFSKLGVQDRLSLVLYASHHGLSPSLR